MKINKYFTVFSVLFLIFMFLYTFNINFDLNQKLNIANLLMILGLFISLLVAGYLFLIKDIIKSSERERKAYGKILDHNKGGKLGSLITGMMRAVIAAEKAEAAGNSNFDKNFQNNLSEQSKRREMEADVQYLR